ncbi:M20 family metallopeptidase [Halorubrum lacusprofundi]|jgi:acetylornithine deacetylase|uniref:Peptidase M20 n=1 Tax=Halorubrum lacusprofundi (strain ATCC 49239 / DSM 5036 / JCM 8891 / ACAM 34) TaxID=416348 RepID=B9LUV1_HALLT|nr:M20/M25/M40 family metallo-hydrolase [Halorubrum lacusprofundi]ACM56428.1 peptidase M20 [Halorubrum lacusprofundi ATCC 49239]MCG1005300.1 M20/M25/M40 family metallo-hydrolase [Halorubrum lacusprofundi]
MDELADLTEKLVAIPSHEDETAAGDAIEEWLRTETDARVERDDAGSVLAYKGETNDYDADTLAFVGHHDVVPPADRQTTGEGNAGGYVVERRDGRIYGRGTADMKGAVAACMLAFRDAEPPAGRELAFASFTGEEVGGTGARHAIDNGFAPERAVVAEGSTDYSTPGVTDVVVAHKGRRASTLVASGTAAHASEPEDGENAIYRASDAIDVVRELDAPESTVFGETVSGSLAVTMVHGGETWNVIPERCEVTIDERTVPGDRADIGRAADAVDGVEWEVDQDLPPMACGDDAFADAVLAAAREVHDQLGLDAPEHVIKPHATDAGWLAEAGTDCLVCGASEPGEAHTDTESVGVDVLERCYRIYRGLAERTF